MSGQSILIKSGGCSVRIRAAEGKTLGIISESEFLGRYVPACEIVADTDVATDGPTIEISRGDRYFEMAYPYAKYRDANLDERDIISVAEMMLERERQANGIYCLHSSSAIVDGRGVVFWGGASGMGKTTMALSFAGLNGGRAYSDEKTLLDAATMKLVGGVRIAHLSKKELSQKHDADYLDLPKDDVIAPIALLVQPQVVPGAKLLVEEWGRDKTEWHMYEELTRKIRGTSRRLFGNTLPVQSIDTDEIARRRSNDSRLITSSIPAIFVRGDAVEIRDAISDILSKQTVAAKE